MSIVRLDRGDKASRAEIIRREADEPRSQVVVQVAYQTYGTLNAATAPTPS
jgi:hypothetical protein